MDEELHLGCPFCGKDDIKYGVSVCSGCQAEIRYGVDWAPVLIVGVILFIVSCILISNRYSFIADLVGLACFIGSLVCIVKGVYRFLQNLSYKKGPKFFRREFR
ncbi:MULTISPECIES: hypothetical protein [unclassified Campylobacter]|uniref:hypothetical protein n=1 Tax=unclassified Campylobacter TaxID=2593542 RepID=UPI0022E9EA89|nr:MULTISPECIES: hypothetical protein [unclassified Campylobacter]MDA3056645.1 hypothetical protein [Campylobacter sp. CN_NA1]MDA3065741.1 hypothetical protein [Campylobacter sp. CN_NE4]MDA3068992.1 hypothetical protein [Campylobacter sp. CN_NE3]MDA3083194.1 hypothetical protein [Campylobacter sp. CN_EL2]MDA3084632.1 hypothetical protein [Campylobacter sp. CN_NE1]